jgi:putative transposase
LTSKKSLGDDADRIIREARLNAARTLSEEIGITAACRALNMSRATFYRRREAKGDSLPRPTPARAVSVDERKAVLDQLNGERFADQSPRQVYSKLLDEGNYLCRVRTTYRILQQNQSSQERRNQLTHPKYKKQELLAAGDDWVA